jgi:hypothetical protein
MVAYARIFEAIEMMKVSPFIGFVFLLDDEIADEINERESKYDGCGRHSFLRRVCECR